MLDTFLWRNQKQRRLSQKIQLSSSTLCMWATAALVLPRARPYCFPAQPKSMCFTLNYLCPCSQPHYISLPPLPFSLSLSFLPHTRCLLASCAQMAEESRLFFFFFLLIACTRSNTQTAVHADKHALSVTERPAAAAGIQDFCPTVCTFLSVFIFRHIHSAHMTTSIWNRCLKPTCDYRQTWAMLREGQEFGCFWPLIGLEGFLCEWLMGKWLDCSFWMRKVCVKNIFSF